MKTIVESAEYNVYSVIQSIKQDKTSWQGWLCLQIELPAITSQERRRLVSADIHKVIESYLKDKKADVYYNGADDILVFCKDIPENILNDIGQSVLGYIAQEMRVCASFIVFDIFKDAERLAESYPLTNLLHNPKPKRKRRPAHPAINKPESFVAPDRPKALLVEDDPITRWAVRTALKGECHLATAQDAGRALHLYQVYKPDIVFLDINLPGKSGREILASMLEMDPGAHIVMFSSNDGMENIVSMMEMGAKGFIAKPFDREKLLYYIGKCGNL